MLVIFLNTDWFWWHLNASAQVPQWSKLSSTPQSPVTNLYPGLTPCASLCHVSWFRGLALQNILPTSTCPENWDRLFFYKNHQYFFKDFIYFIIIIFF